MFLFYKMLRSSCFDFNNLLILNNSSNITHMCILTHQYCLFLLAWHGFFHSMKILYFILFLQTALSNIVTTYYKGKHNYTKH